MRIHPAWVSKATSSVTFEVFAPGESGDGFASGGEVDSLVATFEIGSANSLHSCVVGCGSIEISQHVSRVSEASDNSPISIRGFLVLEGIVAYFACPFERSAMGIDIGNLKG